VDHGQELDRGQKVELDGQQEVKVELDGGPEVNGRQEVEVDGQSQQDVNRRQRRVGDAPLKHVTRQQAP
jgi:hypothetical protein